MPKSAKASRAQHADSHDLMQFGTEWVRLQRAIFLDVPLMMATEMSIFAKHVMEEQARHWRALAACDTYGAVIEENRRHISANAAELSDEVDAIAREAAAALNAA